VIRDLSKLQRNKYDLLVIGGGIYGACVTWDAALRGLSVALVEKGDFASATSANSLKIIHGGLRYLQHGDIKRMRESIRERRTLMGIAPHLVHPLPVLIPTYGHGMQGREVLSLALMINDLIGFDRNRLDDPDKHMCRGRVISRGECVELLPGIHEKGLTGGAIFHDAQLYNSERLVLSFIRSAEEAGAELANYVEVTGFIKEKNRIIGVEAKDVLTKEDLCIRARTVVNTCGPWVNRVLNFLNGSRPDYSVPFLKAINLITRPLFQKYAVGVAGENGQQDTDSLIKKRKPFLFATPWRGHTLIGTAYSIYNGSPDEFKVTEKDIQDFLNQINQAYPSAGLKMKDVSYVHGGLVPSSPHFSNTRPLELSKHYQIYDHRNEGVTGLISVIGTKYTTARHVAEKVVNRVFESWQQKPPKSLTSTTTVHGGQIGRFGAFLQGEIKKHPESLGENQIRRLVYNHGSAYPRVLRYLDLTPSDDHDILRAEIRYAVREEMAQKLTDVVFRRTDLGTAGHPGSESLKTCADTMSGELGWSLERTQQELKEVNETFNFCH